MGSGIVKEIKVGLSVNGIQPHQIREGEMTLQEAQNVACRMANLNSDKITLEEIKQALVLLANFYEDYKHLLTKNDPDHPDYVDPFIDNDNPNFN